MYLSTQCDKGCAFFATPLYPTCSLPYPTLPFILPCTLPCTLPSPIASTVNPVTVRLYFRTLFCTYIRRHKWMSPPEDVLFEKHNGIIKNTFFCFVFVTVYCLTMMSKLQYGKRRRKIEINWKSFFCFVLLNWLSWAGMNEMKK